MPPVPATPTPTFTPAQTRIIMIAFKHLKGCPEADWDAVAAEYGYKDGPLAKSKFQLAMATCKNASVPASKPRSGGKRKADEGDPPTTPTKKKRGRPTKDAKAEEDEGDSDDSPLKAKTKDDAGVKLGDDVKVKIEDDDDDDEGVAV